MLLADAGEPGRVAQVVPVPNVSADPRRRFEIAPAELLRVQSEARRGGLEILGYYHSHPDHAATPSDTDRRLASEGLSEGVFHLIVSVGADGEPKSLAWVFRDSVAGFEPEPLEIE